MKKKLDIRYYLESGNTEVTILSIPAFDKELIKLKIIHHLRQNPKDTIYYYKVCVDQSEFVGDDILGIYEVNPKSGKISKLIFRGEKTYYRSLED